MLLENLKLSKLNKGVNWLFLKNSRTKKIQFVKSKLRTLMIESKDLWKNVTEVKGEKSNLKSDIEGEKVKVSSMEREILVKCDDLIKLINEK